MQIAHTGDGRDCRAGINDDKHIVYAGVGEVPASVDEEQRGEQRRDAEKRNEYSEEENGCRASDADDGISDNGMTVGIGYDE